MAPRRRCPTCGSKQWHKEPSSGLIACSEGHILQNYRNETTEITEMGPHAMKKRSMKSGKKKSRSRRANPLLYHGGQGRLFYFFCLQYILRKQVTFLTQHWSLPPEFEVICKDLWALYLTLLPDALPFEGDTQGVGSREEEKEDASGKEDLEQDQNQDQGQSSDSGESEVEEIDEEEEDAELKALMAENSEGSSSEEEEGQRPVPNAKQGRKAMRRSAYESPKSTIAVIVVACWMLRLPIMYRDLTKLIETHDLPYLEIVKILPGSMVRHLTRYNVRKLSPAHAPETLSVHGVASRFSKKLQSEYGILTPELNAACVLWRITKKVGGTPLMYKMAKRVASALSQTLTLHSSLAPGLEKARKRGVAGHEYDNAPAEVQMATAVMIVLKLVYGMDGKARSAKREDDIGGGLPDKRRIVEMLMKGEKKGFEARNMLAVGDLKEEDMEEYISFCGRALLGPARDGEGVLEGFFELEDYGGRREEEEEEGEWAEIQEMKEEAGMDGFGFGYKIWTGADECGAGEEESEIMMGRVCRMMGVGLEYVVRVLEKNERRLVEWEKAERRRRDRMTT